MPKQKEREARKPIDLSKSEKAQLLGLQAREREIQRDLITPLQEDYREFAASLEHNHGVELGKDYSLNAMTGELIPLDNSAEPIKD